MALNDGVDRAGPLHSTFDSINQVANTLPELQATGVVGLRRENTKRLASNHSPTLGHDTFTDRVSRSSIARDR